MITKNITNTKVKKNRWFFLLGEQTLKDTKSKHFKLFNKSSSTNEAVSVLFTSMHK